MRVKTVYIEITNRCNLNCCTCYNRSGLNTKTQEISAQQIEKIISLFSSYGANRFLFSGGEPTLHSEFDQILDIVEKHPEYAFGFVTNGTSRDPRFIGLLNRNDNITLQISLDGSCEEQNAKTRGAGHFDMALDFARMIHNKAYSPLLKMVISQENLSDVESFYHLAVSVGFTPEFAFIYKSGNGAEDWERKKLSPHQKMKVLKTVDKLNRQYHVNAFLPRCTTTCPFVHGGENMSICIKTDGSIQPCQSLYSSQYTLANCFHFDEKELLQNLSQTLSAAQRRTTADFGCAKCMLKDVCGRGCIAEAVHLTGDPLGDDEGCLFRKLQFLDSYSK